MICLELVLEHFVPNFVFFSFLFFINVMTTINPINVPVHVIQFSDSCVS